MKEIKGNNKIKFLAIPILKNNSEYKISNYGFAGMWLEEVGTQKITLLSRGKIANYSILGKATELTEENCKKLIDSIHVELAPSPYNDFAGGFDYAFIDYQNTGEFAGFQGDAGCYRKPKDSFKSLLEANECYIKDWIVKPLHIFSDSPIEGESKMYQECLERHGYNNKISKAADDFLIIEVS